VRKLPTLGSLESVADLGINVALKDEYDTCILQFWYLLIDMHFILLHVEFEDGLSVSFLKNKATCHKKLQLEIDKGSKKGQLGSLFLSPTR
jgi:hypothetical protein